MADVPETKWARVGGDRIAYQVIGDGPVDLVYNGGLVSHGGLRWEHPGAAAYMRAFGEFSRFIVYDRRGTGLSDPLSKGKPTWERGVEDVLAVMDAAGSERSALYGFLDAGAIVLLTAATHPDRVTAVIPSSTTARYLAAPKYAPGVAPADAASMVDAIEKIWGTEEHVRAQIPSLAGDPEFRDFYGAYLRAAIGARAAAEALRGWMYLDIRSVLPAVTCPALVLHYEKMYRLGPEHGKWLASHLPRARFVPLAGDAGAQFTPKARELTDTVHEFLAGVRRIGRDSDRVLATVLLTDIVASTDTAARLGDHRWRELLDAHDRIARKVVDACGGHFVKSTGDGVLATFDGPGRAVRAATELVQALSTNGVEVRVGLHTGEVVLRGQDVGGIAVHIAARVMAMAEPSEVLVSRTVRDLVMGSELSFLDRGTHALKGIPEKWQLFAVESA